MKDIKEKLLKTGVTALMVSTMAFTNITYVMADTDIISYSTTDSGIMPCADTTYHYGPVHVDSNQWTTIDTQKKISNNIFLSVYVGKMWESVNGVQGDTAAYQNLYARFLVDGDTAIMTNSESENIVAIPEAQGGGKGVLLTKESPSVEKLRTTYQKEGVKIKFQEMGHTPYLDCFAKGYWNPDRRDN